MTNAPIANVGVSDLVDLTTGIAAAFVQNNVVQIGDLPKLLSTIHDTLAGLGGPAAPVDEVTDIKTSAEIKKSVKPDGITSFIDGKAYKTLKRHVTKHGMTLEQYKTKFGLPSDYPTTSANYSAQRSALAKSLGLGQGGAATKEAA